MKICPNCQQKYDDDGLNFCLNDGSVLEADNNEPPPTVMINQARSTSPNVGNDFTQPISPWLTPPSPMSPYQQQTPAYTPPVYSSGGGSDQTLPTISLVLGSCSVLFSLIFCCFGGVLGLPLGIAAGVTGFMAMNNVNQNPQKFGGKGMAIGGMITGGVGVLFSLGWLLLIMVGR